MNTHNLTSVRMKSFSRCLSMNLTKHPLTSLFGVHMFFPKTNVRTLCLTSHFMLLTLLISIYSLSSTHCWKFRLQFVLYSLLELSFTVCPLLIVGIFIYSLSSAHCWNFHLQFVLCSWFEFSFTVCHLLMVWIFIYSFSSAHGLNSHLQFLLYSLLEYR